MKAISRQQPLTVTVHVPMRFTTRSNSKRIISNGAQSTPRLRPETSLIKALARAHRWRSLIEQGEYLSITDLAKDKQVNQSYACRILRLTLLSPTTVVAILDGLIDPVPTVNELMKPMPSVWVDQERRLKSGNLRGS